MTTQTEALKLALEALEKHGDAYLGHSDEYYFAIEKAKEALAQPEQEPVAYLVTGPYEKTAFSDIDSANAYCRGLNKGFGADAYIVSHLYTTPPQRKE